MSGWAVGVSKRMAAPKRPPRVTVRVGSTVMSVSKEVVEQLRKDAERYGDGKVAVTVLLPAM